MPGDPEAPFSGPIDPHISEVLEGPQLSRRKLLGYTVGALTAAALRRYSSLDATLARLANTEFQASPLGAGDQAVNKAIYAEEGWNEPIYTTIEIYKDKDHPAPKNAPATNFIFTGLGEIFGRNLAVDVSRATKHKLPTRYQQSGNQPITIDEMTGLFIDSMENDPLDTPTYGVTLHSMSDIMFFLMLKRCGEIGYKPPKKLSFINMLSSPSGIHTANFGELGAFFSKADIGQEAVGKYVVSFFRAWEERNFNPMSLKTDLRQANRQFVKGYGAAPALLTSQMNILDAVDSRNRFVSLLYDIAPFISRNTKISYFGPHRWMRWTDTVVNEKAAYGDIAYGFKKVRDIDVAYIGGGVGHANYTFATQQESTALQQACTPEPQLLPFNFTS
jgi:hypothetical protein